jgi:antitoxin component YwqK of YwqJK toxin-antitoxin module
MTQEIKVKRFYYPSGKLHAERSFVNGIPHGKHREWHENGVLASETTLNNGVPDGVGKQWDEGGNLLASYEIKGGTGIQETWFPEQGIRTEISWINGNWTGRQRTYWIDDGEVIGDTFWIKGAEVSKKRYQEACKKDRDLPKYEE